MADEADTPAPATPTTAAKTTATRKRATKPRAKRTTTSRAKSVPRPAEVRERIEDVEVELEEHVAGLSDQLAELRVRVEHFAERSAAGARDLVSGASYAGAMATRQAGHQVVRAARAVRSDPLPAILGLGILTLVTAVIVTRWDDRYQAKRWFE